MMDFEFFRNNPPPTFYGVDVLTQFSRKFMATLRSKLSRLEGCTLRIERMLFVSACPSASTASLVSFGANSSNSPTDVTDVACSSESGYHSERHCGKWLSTYLW